MEEKKEIIGFLTRFEEENPEIIRLEDGKVIISSDIIYFSFGIAEIEEIKKNPYWRKDFEIKLEKGTPIIHYTGGRFEMSI